LDIIDHFHGDIEGDGDKIIEEDEEGEPHAQIGVGVC